MDEKIKLPQLSDLMQQQPGERIDSNSAKSAYAMKHAGDYMVAKAMFESGRTAVRADEIKSLGYAVALLHISPHHKEEKALEEFSNTVTVGVAEAKSSPRIK